ncbi:MAG TPA: c-type cytochrome [Gemmatimonadales bacterium]|nr:c-type cytochrome [Gemmatimonadales bacterium]
MLRSAVVRLLVLVLVPGALTAQAPGKWPPDSLINVKVFPKNTPVNQVVGQMRNITQGLGVRCHYCHEGEEGTPLEKTDFASDKKRPKLVARQMLRMVQEINARLDTIPERPSSKVDVTCRTCHRGVSRPMPLANVVIDASLAAGADSGLRAYQGLREKYYGRDSYDFGESSLNVAAFRLARENKFDDALKVLDYNEKLFPNSSGMSVFRGNVLLLKGDTASAANAFREAIRRDSTNGEARGRLKDLGQK